jgi:hypothetical protein
MLQQGQPSINRWVRELRGSPPLQVACGLEPGGRSPGVGTFYDFLHRLHDGKRRDNERPSRTERARSKTPKPPKPKPSAKEKTDGGTVTAKLVATLAAAEADDRPEDLLKRLADLLLEVAVKPSADRGLLGDLSALVVHGDGSALTTGACRRGDKRCEHKKFEKCDCPRLFHDPDAAWGYVASLEKYFFGHHFYELSVGTEGHDLPIAIRLDPGNSCDFVQSLETFDHMAKQWREASLPWSVQDFIADAGHDAEPIYAYFVDRGIHPFIPLRDIGKHRVDGRPDLELSARGVPLCQAGVEMIPWGTSGTNHAANFLCPVGAKRLARCPMAPDEDPSRRCRPELKLGPTVTDPSETNPRIFPPVARNTDTFQRMMNLRSACERSNAAKKVGFKLEAARHRRASFWLIRLHLCAIAQHARAWLAKADAEAWLTELLRQERRKAA